MDRLPICVATSFTELSPSLSTVLGSIPILSVVETCSPFSLSMRSGSKVPLETLEVSAWTLRGLGAGVMRSCGLRSIGDSRATDVDAARRTPPYPSAAGLNRTTRWPPDSCELGDSPRYFNLSKDNGLRLSFELDARPDISSLVAVFLFDAEDSPIRETSSPRIAFASALNTIGGTGTSSSELSPIENFQSWESGALSGGGIECNGGPRFSIGREGLGRRLGRGTGRREKLSRLMADGVGEAAAMMAKVTRERHAEIARRLD